MATPATRTPIKLARGSYSNLYASIDDIQEGEIVYAEDQNQLYVKEGSQLIDVTGDGGSGSGSTNLSYTTSGAGLSLESSSGSNVDLPAATTGAWGLMTDEDKTKLDGLTSSATNLTNTANDTSLTIESSSGNNTALPAATTSAWGVMTDEDKTKLDGIETSATADQTDAEIRTAVEAATDSNVFTDADHTKLNGIETSATADQTGAEIKSAYEAESDTNAFTDADHTKLDGIAASANNYSHPNHSGEVTSSGDGATTITDNVVDEANLKISNSPSDGKFLQYKDGTDELTWAVPTDTNTTYSVGDGGLTQNNFTNTLKTKLDGIEASATADQTGAEIKSAYEGESDTNAYTDAEKTKLAGIAASANNYAISSDLVDEDNMSSNSATKVPSQQSVKAYVDTEVAGVVDSAPGALNTLNELAAALGDDANFSTTVTNSIAAKLPLGGGTMTGNIVMSGSETVDGRDLSVDGTKLDGIASSANNYTHPSVNHIPAGGSSGQVLKYSSSGTAAWGTDNDTTYTVGDGGLTQNNFTNTLKSKLDGIEGSADVTDATNVDSAGAVMNSDLDGKGELLVGDGSGDPTALAVGTNNYVLTADSGEATGVKWAAASGGGASALNDLSDVTTGTVSTGNVLSWNGSAWASVDKDEGTGIKSTGETGTTKFLRVDGDGSCSWQVPPDTNTQVSIDDTPVNGVTNEAISSNWAYDHNAATGNSAHVPAAGSSGQFLKHDGTWGTPPDTNTQVSIDDTPVDGVTNEAISSNWAYDHNAGTGNSKHVPAAGSSGQFLKHDGTWGTPPNDNTQRGIDDTPVDGQTAESISSNWAYDHNAATGNSAHVPAAGSSGQFLKHDGTWGTPTDTNTQLSNAEVRTAVEAATDSNVFTDDDHSKLNGITANANNYSHPNHSGDVTSSGDGATTIADNAVTLAKMAGLARGKIIYGDASGDPAALAPGSANQVLTSDGTDISWAAASGGGGGASTGETYVKYKNSSGAASDSGTNTYAGYNGGNALANGATENTIYGYEAGDAITTGDSNTCIGMGSGSAISTNGYTTCIGGKAGQSNTAHYTTAVGYKTLNAATSGTGNTGVGGQALRMHQDGINNTAVGYEALRNQTTAASNSALGFGAGKNIESGTNNSVFGESAGDALTTGDNNLILGHDAAASAVDVSNEITLGDTAITKFRIPGLNSFEINDSGVLSGVASTANATAGVRKITASTSAPSGGADGDVWIKYTA